MNFKAVFAVLLVLSVCVVSQSAEEDQKKGGTLEQLTEAINRNSDITIKNSQKIDNLPGTMDQYYRKQTATIIGGVSVFILILYCVYMFFDKLRRLKKKVTHEEYIMMLEARYIDRETELIETLKRNNRETGELLDKTKEILRDKSSSVSGDFVGKREFVLNLGTILVAYGFMCLTYEAINTVFIWGYPIFAVLYKLLGVFALVVGLRLWMIYHRSEVK